MKNNKLIAEFMGVKPTILGDEITYEMYGAIDCIEDGVDEQHFFLEEQLLFHTSWDWLIPVVEKIENGGLDPHELIDKSLRKNNQKRWRSIEDLYNVAVYLIKIHNNGQRQNN